MQNFAAIGPFGAEIWRGGQFDPPPPPSKNLLSKSPVKIGLKEMGNQINGNKIWHSSAIYIQNMNITWLLCKKFSMIKSVKCVFLLHLVLAIDTFV